MASWSSLWLGLPFTADQAVSNVQHLANGMSITNEIKGHVYRSAEGVERYEGTSASTDPANPEPITQIYILDRNQHTFVMLNSKLKTATVQHLLANATVTVNFLPLQVPAQYRTLKVENMTTIDLEKRTQDMMDVVGKRVTVTIPAGKIGNSQPMQVVTEVWDAPQEKLVVKQIEQNPLAGERTFELTNIRGEEPDPTLFKIPDGYTVKEQAATPSGLTMPSAPTVPEQRTKEIEAALSSPDPIIKNMATAAEDTRNAGVASGYVTQLAGMGKVGETRLEASRAGMTADRAAAAVETAAAAVESDASQTTAASTAGDKAAVNNASNKAASDYSALLKADDQLTKAAKALAAAAADNVAFYATNPGNAAINDMGAQDSSAAAKLLSAATKGGTGGYSAAAANEATAIKDANTIAGLDPTRTPAFQAAAKAEAEAQSAAKAATAGGSASAAAAAVAEAATAGVTADGPGNPYAGAVESGAAAVANAASATISAQYAMDRLKMLK